MGHLEQTVVELINQSSVKCKGRRWLEVCFQVIAGSIDFSKLFDPAARNDSVNCGFQTTPNKAKRRELSGEAR